MTLNEFKEKINNDLRDCLACYGTARVEAYIKEIDSQLTSLYNHAIKEEK